MDKINDILFPIILVSVVIFSICLDFGFLIRAIVSFAEDLIIESIIYTALFSLLTATLVGVIEYIDKNF